MLCMILDCCDDNNNKQSVGPSRRSKRLQPLVGASAALKHQDPTSHGKSSSHAATDYTASSLVTARPCVLTTKYDSNWKKKPTLS